MTYVVVDMLDHSWANGYDIGYRTGFQQGLQQPTRGWKSGAPAGKIMESRQPGQDAPHTT